MSQQFQPRPADEDDERSRPAAFVVIGSLVVGALIIGAAIVVPSAIDSANAAAAAGDIYLEPASFVGTNPVSPTALTAAPAGAAPIVATAPTSVALPTTGTSTTATRTFPGTTTSGTANSGTAHHYISIPTANGGRVGMYGGSLNEYSCDIAKQVAYLKSVPAKAKAWVDALNTDASLDWAGGKLKVADLATYFSTLTPADVRVDTLVTDHGWLNDRFTSYHAILQKGTSALVDKHGVFRARCICGNPLTLATPVKGKITLKNRKWKDFDINKVATVTASPKPLISIPIVTPTNTVIDRPVGQGGGPDVPTTSTTAANDLSLLNAWINTPTAPSSPTDQPSGTPTDTSSASTPTDSGSAAAPTEADTPSADPTPAVATGPVGVSVTFGGLDAGYYVPNSRVCPSGEQYSPPPGAFSRASSLNDKKAWKPGFDNVTWGGCAAGGVEGPSASVTVVDYTGSTVSAQDAAREEEATIESQYASAGVSDSVLAGCTSRDVSTTLGEFSGRMTTYGPCAGVPEAQTRQFVFFGDRSDGTSIVVAGSTADGHDLTADLNHLLTGVIRSVG